HSETGETSALANCGSTGDPDGGSFAKRDKFDSICNRRLQRRTIKEKIASWATRGTDRKGCIMCKRIFVLGAALLAAMLVSMPDLTLARGGGGGGGGHGGGGGGHGGGGGGHGGGGGGHFGG